jgi:hypothetical protein
MASSEAEIVKFIKLQEDKIKLQQQLYISFLPYTSADDKIKMFQNLKRQSVNITIFKEQLSQKEEQKSVKPCGMSKEDHGKLIKNYVRLVAELPTSDIADYLKQSQILTEEMMERILNKETLQDRNRHLLTILFRRGGKDVPCLIDGLCFLNCNAIFSLLQN